MDERFRQATPPTPTANERWKRAWSQRFASSILVAVALHAAVFALSPSWALRDSAASPSVEWPGAFEVTPVSAVEAARARPEGAGVATIPAAPVAGGREEAARQDRRGSEAGSGGTARGQGGVEVAGMSEDLWERLRGRIPVPTVTEPVPEPRREEDAPTGPDEGEDPLAALRGEASTADGASVLELDGPELDRLSALRPELALSVPDGWILVRNPREVRSFVREVYDRGRLEPDRSGTVSVALWIDEEGSVEWAEIADSSGRDELDRMALSLFTDVVDFWPAREDGIAVPTSAILSVVFPWN